MARMRTLKPGFFSSLDIADLRRDTRLHFAGLWTYADDEGRGVDDPRLLKAAIWPLDDDITTDDIERMQAELAKHDRIVRYNVAGRRHFQIHKWHEHQKPNRPQESVLPAPADGEPLAPPEDSLNDHGTLTNPALPEGRVEEGRVEGEVGEGENRGALAPPCDPPDQVDVLFDDFWSRYPRGKAGKPGGDGPRKPALRRWRNITAAQREASLRAVDNYRAHVESLDGPHAAHAVTWLNQERWDQWQTPARPSSRDGPGHAAIYDALGDELEAREAQS